MFEEQKLSSAQMNGMRGVYLVAAELARRGLITSPTSRSARGADILVTTTNLSKAFSVEVKTTTSNKFWQLSPHAKTTKADSHTYVFVHIRKRKDKEEMITYYPVSSKFVAENSRLPNPDRTEKYRKGYSMDLREVEMFKNNWSIFGVPGEAAA
jgi:hypothetical protein